MILGKFKAVCDYQYHGLVVKLEAATEWGTIRELQKLGWKHDKLGLNITCPECQKKQKNSVKDLLDNIDDPIMDWGSDI